MARPVVATYSIVACDLDAQQWGVSVQSKFLSVGSVVPWGEPQVGAIATQAYANPRYGPNGLALLREGLSAREVVDRLTGEDEGRDHRQLSHTHLVFAGDGADEFAARMAGRPYAASGIRVTTAATREASEDELRSLARARRVEALRAGITHLEIKSGYGLEPEAERRSCAVAAELTD